MKSKATFLSLVALSAVTAFAGETDKKVIVPPEPADNKWEVLLAMPMWMAGVQGDIGIGSKISSVDVNADKIIHRIDMAAALRGEVRKGRFGAQFDFLYLSLSDGIGANGLVQDIHARMDEILTDFGVSYRLLEGPRGWVDARAGFRYTNIFQSVTLFPNSANIQAASTQLVDAASTLVGNALRNQVSQIINGKLSDLNGGGAATLPVGPLAGQVPSDVLNNIQGIIDAHGPEIAAAIQSGVQTRIAAAKASLANDISQTLNARLSTQHSRTDDWFDPYVGLRARYNFNEKFYFLAKADIGGFGVGSSLTWQASGAFGWQINRRIFAEAGYRYLYVDYKGNGLTYNVATQGAEISLGIRF